MRRTSGTAAGLPDKSGNPPMRTARLRGKVHLR